MRLPLGAKALGLTVMCMLAATLAYSFKGPWRQVYLPGRTTDGHYQIELSCSDCHTSPFAGADALQTACVRCHGAELNAKNDAHPEKKFRDPRNADRVKQLDARQCITCHREHRAEGTSSMGLTVPVDYCFRCHADIGKERPSHQRLAFDSCANIGCHHFHDNRSLYEDFLVKHLHEPDLLPQQRLPARAAPAAPLGPPTGGEVPPAGVQISGPERDAFSHSAHASAGVSCVSCHRDPGEGKSGWSQGVSDELCAGCHAAENRGFRAGRHGMRLASHLPPMRVADARQPMRPEAGAREVGCTSCHSSHAFDTRRAAVDACLGCHADQHSLSYRGSAHELAWLADGDGRSGASCATCHLPRSLDGGLVEHNQSANLRPRDAMLRGVCLQCHGLGFAIDALADATLVNRNFRGRPTRHVDSLTMAEQRLSR